ncbi:MAG TPA: 6-phosphogluconolactonase [Pirellulaceae bacterium]
MAEPRILVSADVPALCDHLAGRLGEYAAATLARRPRFSVALTGGRTPRAFYERLAERMRKHECSWTGWDFFWGDERSVPPGHADSNYRMAWESLLGPAGVNPEHIHRLPGESGDLNVAAKEYADLIARHVPENSRGIPVFDLILLGMGDDGHTASLFPGTAALREEEQIVVANWVPQLETYRLTMTYPLINAGRCVWYLVTGAAKAPLLKQVLGRQNDPMYPCQHVNPPDGELVWWLDADAAAELADIPRTFL